MTKKEKKREYEKELRQIKKETQENVSDEMAQFKRRRKEKNLVEVNTAKKQQQRNNLRNNLKMSLKLNVDVGNTEYYLGCTILEFKQYIESQFDKEMTWENMGYKSWHLEHIKPLFLFDLSKDEEKKKAGHYTNLRPMWYKHHRLKTKFEKQEYKDNIINPRYLKEDDENN